jgi:hypothetical protein
MKYGAVTWRGVWKERARRLTKRLARKQERRKAKEECQNGR